MHLHSKFLVFLSLCLGAINVYAEPYEVLKLTGKSQLEISNLLGEPSACNDTYQGLSCNYPNHKLDIIFIEERADWITYNDLEDVPFDHSAIEHIGLIKATPFVHNPIRMHWQDHHGLSIISAFGNGKNTLYIQVRAYTPQ